jgi:hypothetical protein
MMDCPEIKPRQPFVDVLGEGVERDGECMMESDRDFVMGNLEAAVFLLERELEEHTEEAVEARIRAHGATSHKGWPRTSDGRSW